MPKPLKLSNQVDGHRQERLEPRSLTTHSVSPTSLTTHMGMMMVVMMVMMMVMVMVITMKLMMMVMNPTLANLTHPRTSLN